MATIKGCCCNCCRNQNKTKLQSQRRYQSSKIYTGDEHWTKVLQASEVQGHSCHHQRQQSICDRCCRLHATRSRNRSLSASSCMSSLRNSPKTRLKTILQSIYSQFCDWFRTSCRGFGSSFLCHFTTCDRLSFNSLSENDRVRGSDALLVQTNLDNASVLSKHHEDELETLCNYVLQSSEESEFGSAAWTSCSSSSSMTMASNTTLSSSEGCVPFLSDRPLPVNLEPGYLPEPECISEDETGTFIKDIRQKHSSRTDRSSLIIKRKACRLKHLSLSLPEKETKADLFFCTWPLAHHNLQGEDSRKTTEISNSPKHLVISEPYNGENRISLNESSIEWSIPYSDLIFDQIIKCSTRHQIFRGRWHGDVLIHTYCGLEPKEVTEFLKQVLELSRIRHENVCLFMGACIHLPKLAVITSDLKGPSLYEKIHLLSDKVSMRSCVSIARQVSVAMGYLHAKGVLARKLNSRNIYLEPKVKLSLLDHETAEAVHVRYDSVSLPRGNLCYIAPEMLSTIVVRNSQLLCTFSPSQEIDIFAFGTLLYELITGQFPLGGFPIETLIWRVCKGWQPSLTHLNCNSALKVLIERCWAYNPDDRPTFSEINQELLQKPGLHKFHSSSQPERLDRNTFHSHRIRQVLYRLTRQQ